MRTDVVAADDGGVGPDGCALAHPGFGILVPPNHRTAGVVDVRENATRAEKHIVFTLDTRIEAHVVLDLAIPAEFDIWTDDHILADVATFPENSAGHDVAKVPDFRSGTNCTALINHRRFVCKPIVLSSVADHFL
jgi:hypothetical protein